MREFLRSGDRPHSIFASNPEKNFSVPKDPYADPHLQVSPEALRNGKPQSTPGEEFFSTARAAFKIRIFISAERPCAYDP